MITRRTLLSRSALLAGGAALLDRLSASLTGTAHAQHQGHSMPMPEATPAPVATASPMNHGSQRAYTPVVTPNGSTLPFKVKSGAKEFHLIAEPVQREFAPGMVVNCWGYNGLTPGPTIEAVEGDRVRILLTNKLPEHTSVQSQKCL